MNNKKHIVNLEYFREILQICPKLPNQQFKELPFEEEILTFLIDLGHSGEIKVITDVKSQLHQPWRSFATEEFVYQVENKNVKRRNEMYYPCFTKVIVNFFMTKDSSIPRRNRLYGAILPDELTNEAIKIPNPTKCNMPLLQELNLLKQKQVLRRSKLDMTRQRLLQLLKAKDSRLPPLSSATKLPPPTIPLITHLQQTPAPTPTTVPSSSLQDLPNFAVSSIPDIIDAYLANKMHEAVKIAIQLHRQTQDEAQAEIEDFNHKLEYDTKKNNQGSIEVLTRSSNESKTSHVVATNLYELELKKILIDKMESNKSIHKSDEQKNLYKALVDAYESDKLILDTYGDTVLFKRRQDDEDKDEEPYAGSYRGSKRRRA
ncbi:hypothetical protein Tco_0814783 [Tanacetum coccineum]